jgi:hypothetical protein
VFFNDQQALDEEIADMMREVRNIQAHMQPVITELYRRFLMDSAETEELEYGTYDEELTANFIYKAYMSMADLGHCAAFDTVTLAEAPGQEVIGGLHSEVLGLVARETEEELEPA